MQSAVSGNDNFGISLIANDPRVLSVSVRQSSPSTTLSCGPRVVAGRVDVISQQTGSGGVTPLAAPKGQAAKRPEQKGSSSGERNGRDDGGGVGRRSGVAVQDTAR